ncbi:MAG TPA: ImmA/IrrE family metallo-endopeptidase [Brevibacillus sp.]|nr:ImmA/IrrE family metallo-endopeptidase [Brevibacillus sp.]
MTFPNSARYGWVIKLVHKFLLENNISSFPVDPFKIIEANKWGLITFTELATEHNVSIAEVIEAFQSEDGYTMYDGSGYTIAYNDTIGSPGRIRFTLMHEIGHIYLKHLVDFEETILRRSTLTERKYKVLENETNCFARNVLAPAPIVNRLKLRSAIDLVHHFHVTEAAARTRLDLLKRDSIFTINFALSLINQFRKYLHIVANSKYCYCCKYHFLHETAVYCPICGSRKLSKRKGFEIMNYSGIKVDENYRAIQCPTCENENVYGEY